MIFAIVKQAIQTKQTCKTESPLISEAEYGYACAKALRELRAPQELITFMHQADTIEELRDKMTPFFEGVVETYKEQPLIHRLLTLLIHSRVEGKISDEVRKIMDEK